MRVACESSQVSRSRPEVDAWADDSLRPRRGIAKEKSLEANSCEDRTILTPRQTSRSAGWLGRMT